jgi:hypothetical protein
MCAARETAPFSAAATKYWICRNENAIAVETINAVVGSRFSAERCKYPTNLALQHETCDGAPICLFRWSFRLSAKMGSGGEAYFQLTGYDGYWAASAVPRGRSGRGAIRATVSSIPETCHDRLTSIRDVAQTSQMRKKRSSPEGSDTP